MRTQTTITASMTLALATALVCSVASAQTANQKAAPSAKPATVNTTPAAPMTATPAAALNPGSSSISAEETKAAVSTSSWSPSVSLYNFKGANDDKTLVGNVVYLNLGYKLSDTLKIAASQRFRYDLKKDQNDPAQAKRISDLNLRINLTQSDLKLFGAEGSVLYRVTLPTNAKSRVNDRMLAYFLFNPNLSWKLNSALEASYSLAYQTTTYSSADYTTEMDKPMTEFNSATDRMNHGVSNSGTLTYNISDKFNVYQTLGHSLSARNSGKGASPKTGLSVHGGWADISTGLNWAPVKGLSFNAYLSQNHAVVESDNIGIIAANSDQVFGDFMLYRPEQTSIELFTSLAF